MRFPTSASTNDQLDRLADAAEHFHQRVDGEFGRFLVHHVRHVRARDAAACGGSRAEKPAVGGSQPATTRRF